MPATDDTTTFVTVARFPEARPRAPLLDTITGEETTNVRDGRMYELKQ